MTRGAAVRSLVAGAVVAGVVIGYWWLRSPETTLVKVGHAAPDLELPSLGAQGKTRLSSFRGRPLLLVMFLANCELCEAEVPAIERLHRRMLPRGLLVIGVSADQDRASLEAFVGRHQVTFPVLEDPGGQALRQAYGTWQLPEAYLIDASGKVAAVWLGSVTWSGREVQDAISEVLPPPKQGSPP